MNNDRDPSIAGFCQRHRFSRASFYNLVARGEAPRTYKIGTLVRISEEAEADWVRQREAVQPGQAASVARTRVA